MSRTSIMAIVLACGLLGLLVAERCGSRPAKQDVATADTIIDLAGRQVTINKSVERVVLMRSLCADELAAVLGEELEEKLVG